MTMDENTWRLAQTIMWVFGIQTTVLIAAFSGMWVAFSKRFESIDKKLDSMDKRLDRGESTIIHIDKRIVAIETLLHMKECCVLKEDQNLKKAE